MNVEIHASRIKPGMSIATIPNLQSSQLDWPAFDVTSVETLEVNGNSYYRLTDALGNSLTNMTGDYHLLSPVDDAMALVEIDGAYEGGHEYKRTVAVPAPEEGDLFDWWQVTVGDETGDGVTNGEHSHTEAIVTAGPGWLIGQTMEWDFN